jgi:enhanced disease susceptibility 1 protein
VEFIAGSSNSEPRSMDGNSQEQQRDNASDLKRELREKIKEGIDKIEEYRSQCLMMGLGYYDAFKNKRRCDLDFKANIKRLELAALWDQIWLPENFQLSEDWRTVASLYMLLVEPLDIANYYRLGKDEECGPYLTHGRPRRYKAIQQWLEDNEENNQLRPPPAGNDQPRLMLTQDPCLWAHAEEIKYLMGTNNVSDQENLAAEFEERLRRLFNCNGLCMEELLAGESTFKMVVKWLWGRKTPQQQASSCLSLIIA